MLDVLIAIVLALPLWVVAMIWLDTVDPPKGLDVSELQRRQRERAGRDKR